MTEGIVQKVFKKYLNEYNTLPEHDIGILHRKIVTRIELELIKEIRQFNFDWLPKGRITKIIPKNVLIGDGQI